ncbi:uncharacterized protein N7503_011492 [Penicillium pulvis]|uniref:uncharacterized protein n=1 Tax=Penicillium pulvis TaxID=1562058 RepID=UPI0025497338|nr:uncharacterized protein N7503_011492 [Penicillium pulvis]KAJ5786280.1 hypothetical protein N7503_011492 [Penicillium pulvis]
MSTTTTQTRASVPLLADYELHHSGSQVNEPPASSPSQQISWPAHYRRIPPHRPINYNLDYDERPAGSNPAETQTDISSRSLNYGGKRAEGSTTGSSDMKLEENGSGGMRGYRGAHISVPRFSL